MAVVLRFLALRGRFGLELFTGLGQIQTTLLLVGVPDDLRADRLQLIHAEDVGRADRHVERTVDRLFIAGLVGDVEPHRDAALLAAGRIREVELGRVLGRDVRDVRAGVDEPLLLGRHGGAGLLARHRSRLARAARARSPRVAAQIAVRVRRIAKDLPGARLRVPGDAQAELRELVVAEDFGEAVGAAVDGDRALDLFLRAVRFQRAELHRHAVLGDDGITCGSGVAAADDAVRGEIEVASVRLGDARQLGAGVDQPFLVDLDVLTVFLALRLAFLPRSPVVTAVAFLPDVGLHPIALLEAADAAQRVEPDRLRIEHTARKTRFRLVDHGRNRVADDAFAGDEAYDAEPQVAFDLGALLLESLELAPDLVRLRGRHLCRLHVAPQARIQLGRGRGLSLSVAVVHVGSPSRSDQYSTERANPGRKRAPFPAWRSCASWSRRTTSRSASCWSIISKETGFTAARRRTGRRRCGWC